MFIIVFQRNYNIPASRMAEFRAAWEVRAQKRWNDNMGKWQRKSAKEGKF
jgi:hypothetical protein